MFPTVYYKWVYCACGARLHPYLLSAAPLDGPTFGTDPRLVWAANEPDASQDGPPAHDLHYRGATAARGACQGVAPEYSTNCDQCGGIGCPACADYPLHLTTAH